MWMLKMNIQSSARFLEILPDEVESTELSIENGVSQVLLAHFDSVAMDEVRLYTVPGSNGGLHCYLIQIGAQCGTVSSPSFFHNEDHLKRIIARDVSALLKDLFGRVSVEGITMHPTPSRLSA
jgi:hypothetical protein